MVVFVATELVHDPLQADEDEFLQIEKIPVRKVYELMDLGELPDAKSLAALLLARRFLEN
jgi:ADP-ribose pyrophosphatase